MPEGQILRPPPGTGEYLTIEELARLLDTTVNSVRIARSRGLAPASLGVKWRNRVWWRWSDIQAWFDEQLTGQFEEQWDHRHETPKYRQSKSEPVVTEARRLYDEKRTADA